MCFVSVRADNLEVHGFFLLLFGWMSFGLNCSFFCWLANIFYVISSCIVIRKAKASSGFLFPCLSWASCCFSVKQYPISKQAVMPS